MADRLTDDVAPSDGLVETRWTRIRLGGIEVPARLTRVRERPRRAYSMRGEWTVEVTLEGPMVAVARAMP